jgi:hypothetical protein
VLTSQWNFLGDLKNMFLPRYFTTMRRRVRRLSQR